MRDRDFVVPEMVVTEPWDSIKVEGGIVVVKDWLGFSDKFQWSLKWC